MEDPCFNFVSLLPSPHCINIDAIEVADGISRKQIDLLLESLVVEKPLEKPWDKEAILESLVFPLIPCLLLYSVLETGILL